MREIRLVPANYRKPILFALVDDEDFEWLNKYEWTYFKAQSKLIYAMTHINGKTTLMHRLILKAPSGLCVDHRDGNSLNNQSDNLRIATYSQNICNTKKRSNSIHSQYKGVTWNKNNLKWFVKLVCNGIYYYGGYYHSEIEAAKVYDKLAKRYQGEFARLNFPGN